MSFSQDDHNTTLALKRGPLDKSNGRTASSLARPTLSLSAPSLLVLVLVLVVGVVVVGVVVVGVVAEEMAMLMSVS